MNTKRKSPFQLIGRDDNDLDRSSPEIVVTTTTGERIVVRSSSGLSMPQQEQLRENQGDRLDLEEVTNRTGLGKKEILHARQHDGFPRPTGLPLCWRESDIDEWIATRPMVTKLPAFEDFE